MHLSDSEKIVVDECENEILAYLQKKRLARKKFTENIEALLRWRKVRPFLFDGQCLYSRSLLQQILEGYIACCWFEGHEPEERIIHLIKKLMHSGPPPRTPPRTKAPAAGLSFFTTILYLSSNAFGAFFLGN